MRFRSLVVLLLLVGCQTVPVTGRSQLVLLPEREELELGLQTYREVLSKSKLSGDREINAQVERVGRRIAAATERPDFQWEFKVIDDRKNRNAFALPGGKVAVYTGILSVTQDDAGLAVVLGHEVAHAIARHGAERMSQGILAQVGLATVMVSMRNRDPRTVQTVGALLGAGATLGVILPYGRLQESEADHLGLIFMAKAGYDPRVAVDFWQRMDRASREGAPPEFLSTHPSHQTRIRQIEGWLPEALTHYRPQSR
jgi:predicted Zn-dependent protease